MDPWIGGGQKFGIFFERNIPCAVGRNVDLAPLQHGGESGDKHPLAGRRVDWPHVAFRDYPHQLDVVANRAKALHDHLALCQRQHRTPRPEADLHRTRPSQARYSAMLRWTSASASFAFQSASHTGEPWLGPDLLEAIERSRARDILVCPIGFVADHLEIHYYDLDVEAQAFAREREIRLRRTQSFNARSEFIDALAQVTVEARVRAA